MYRKILKPGTPAVKLSLELPGNTCPSSPGFAACSPAPIIRVVGLKKIKYCFVGSYSTVQRIWLKHAKNDDVPSGRGKKGSPPLTEEDEPSSVLESARLLIIGGVSVILVLGLALVVLTIDQSRHEPAPAQTTPVNALATSDNECVECHRQSTPGIIEQYGRSSMARAGVTCQDCHGVTKDNPGAREHEGTYIMASPTPKQCQSCHQKEVREFNQSRHGLPAYVAMWGIDKLSENHREMYYAIPEAQNKPPNQARNALFKMEGRDITRFACESCHNIGKPRVTARSASARNATCVTGLTSSRPENPRPATPATSVPTIPSSRSTRTPPTGSPTTPRGRTGTGTPNRVPRPPRISPPPPAPPATSAASAPPEPHTTWGSV